MSSSDTQSVVRIKPNLQLRLSINKYRIAIFLLSVLYASVLAWLPVDVFKDRVNYLIYAEQSFGILMRYLETGFLPVIANEPIWLLMNAFLGLMLPPELTVRVIIFVPALMVSYYVLCTDPRKFFWLLLIIFFPSVIKNHIIHLRQGVAIAIFLAAWFTKNRYLRLFLYTLTPFIHASFFFVIGLLVLTKIVKRLRFAADLRTLTFLVFSLVVGSGLGWIAALLGARQATEYQFTVTNVSGFGFVLWCVMFLILSMEGKAFIRTHSFELGAIVFYLGTYFLIEVTARIFESAMIPVLLAGLQLSGWRRQSFQALLVFYTVFDYVQRLGVPWLGWGVG